MQTFARLIKYIIRQSREYLTIIPRTRVGYELLDSGRGAEQHLDKNISNFIFYRLEFWAILGENFPW